MVVSNHLLHPPVCGSRRSADLAGRAIAFADAIPASFDTPLAPHHRLIGRWVALRERSSKRYTGVAVRRHIERTFDAAVRAVLAPVDLVDLRVMVLGGDEDRPPALAITCDSMGQLDLGWIEDSDAPIPWRAAVYDALVRMLGRVLPVFGYQDLLETIAIYYWDGETDDDAARHALQFCHGAGEDELAAMPLPSTMDARRPDWMIAANAALPEQLPAALRRMLDRLRMAHEALENVPAERAAWDIDYDTLTEHLPGIEECSSLPPLTLVPVEQFACEVDDIGRHGMETGFMDVAGLCLLPDATIVDDWFASLLLGADFLCAAQDLLRFDPSNV